MFCLFIFFFISLIQETNTSRSQQARSAAWSMWISPGIRMVSGTRMLFCVQCFGSVGWRPIRIRIRIGIQSGSRAFMTKKWKKITAEKKSNFFWSKTAIYLSLSLHKVCPSYRRSLQLTKEAIQHFKTWIFSTFVGHFFALLDPDPDSEYGSGSGSTGPIEYGSNPDPDPKPCLCP